MKKSGQHGGNIITGVNFERVDFMTLLGKIPGYEIKDSLRAGHDIYYQGRLVGQCFNRHAFYEYLEENNIHWQEYISERLLPDDALLVIVREVLFIIEMKHQQSPAAVAENLQTCDFKRKQYLKLVTPLGLKVEYVYVLSDQFKKYEYRDVLNYIRSVNCDYKFNTLPLAWLGLPAGNG